MNPTASSDVPKAQVWPSLMTRATAAKYLSMRVDQFRKREAEHAIPGPVLIAGLPRYRRCDLDRVECFCLR